MRTCQCRIIALALAMLVTGPASTKNMFYVLAAKWCNVEGSGPMRFEITEDGVLLYNPMHGSTCQISSATNVD
jgi:hypothetical protein